MFIRKAPAATSAVVPVNARSRLPFASHFARILQREGAKQKKKLGGALSEFWVSKEYAESCGAKIKSSQHGQHAVTLPLPTHFIKDEKLLKEALCPRVFYNFEALDDGTKVVPEITVPWPRDGHLGFFFRNEEVVDNLMFAERVLKYDSGYWIRDSHPLLGGYLELKEEAAPIIVSISSEVFLLGDQLLKAGKAKKSPLALFHPSFLSEELRKPGMNIFTGELCENPFLLNQREKGTAKHSAGCWFSREQVSKLPKKERDAFLAVLSRLLGKDLDETDGEIIEVQQWTLFNASQLVQPGRLAYERDKFIQPTDDAIKSDGRLFT